jgi:hypothetical protein
MSKHTVVMDALDVVLTLHGPGTALGTDADDVVPEGKAGLVIETASDAVYVIGTPQQLRERVVEGLSLPVPAGVALFDEVEQ